MVTREQILKSTTLPIETVDVPEWGGTVTVRTLNGTDRDSWEQSLLDAKGKTSLNNVRAKLVVKCVVDDAGKRLFDDEDADALGKTSGKALNRVFSVAQRLNGLTNEDVEELSGN